MRPFRTLLAAAFVLGALVLEAFVADGAYSAGSEEYRRVLVVHSYNPEYVWTQNINAGILEALKEQKVVFDYAYMDAKRHPDTPWLTQAGQKALERLRDFGPDVVIAADDVAQTYFVVPYLKGKTSPQVIFCGVNAPPAAYGYLRAMSPESGNGSTSARGSNCSKGSMPRRRAQRFWWMPRIPADSLWMI